MRQVRHLGALVGEDGPVHGCELGQALQGVLGHVRVLPDLPVYLGAKEKEEVSQFQPGGRRYGKLLSAQEGSFDKKPL